MTIQQLCESLASKIEASYEQGVTLDDAEKLAAEFLHAQMQITAQLKNLDLEARMRKSGLKAVRAAVYLEEIKKTDKKPSDVLLGALVDSSDLVEVSQKELDTAEVERDELERYYDIFNNAHIYFRGISKGKFE